MSNTDFGYGQVGPDDGSTDLSAIVAIARRLIERLDVMKLVKVVAVHAGSGSPPAPGTVDVQLLVNQVDGNFYGVPHGTVFGLPYFRFQAGPWAIVADPVKGDVGFVVVADRDSSNVAKNPGQQVNPASRRRYNIADGLYVGGCLNAVPAATIWLKSDGTLVITDKPGNVIQSSSSGIVITGNVKVTGTLEATKLQTDDQGLTVTGNISATGTIIAGQGGADQVGLQTHTHPANGSPPTPGT
jgi:hypothetical protein